jgi:RNA polymerase sigma-70 factor (ECF subfamily)
MLKRLGRSAFTVDAAFPEAGQLERVRAGDEKAFEELFKTYYRPLCDFVYRYVRSRDTAEELVQTVFLRVWEKRESWEPATGIRAYLFAACRNQALDHLKHQRVVERAAALASEGYEPGLVAGLHPIASDETTYAGELADAVRRALGELPERRRSVVILRWEHHLSNLEIARALGISVKGVEAHVSRALATLRQRLAAFRP